MRDFLLNRASRILYPALLLLSVIIFFTVGTTCRVAVLLVGY